MSVFDNVAFGLREQKKLSEADIAEMRPATAQRGWSAAGPGE